MYESPIEFFTKTVAPKIAAEIDGKALEAVFQCGFNVDRDELEKALRYDRDQWRKGFAAGVEHATLKWISVKDRLPDDDAHYLVWVSDACTVERAMYCGDGEWLTEDLENLTRFVTHWMPLPEAPKEE